VKNKIILLIIISLILLCFYKVDLHLSEIFTVEAFNLTKRFLEEFFPPNIEMEFLIIVLKASLETFSMSVVGTVLAIMMGLLLAFIGTSSRNGRPLILHNIAKLLLNILRSIPDLVWASLLIISAGLGPFAGTLALAFHTTGVLGRLFSEALENLPRDNSEVLSYHGVGFIKRLFYVELFQLLPQIISYSLYRWENNIRAAAVLGVVGAGGLGQLLSFNLGLFFMDKASTIIFMMIFLVCFVDFTSSLIRRELL
tara:strand:+ start:6333 stop:7094 length:762 start_codon:yes stop_codon:yes gene_type:complete